MAYDSSKVFLTYQQRLNSSVSEFAVTLVEKSRRTGYTYAAGAIAVMIAAPEKKAQNVYYMGYDYEMAREFIVYVGEWAKKIGEVVSEAEEFIFTDPDKPEKEIKAFRVTFSNGKEVVALPSVARAFRGKQGVVLIDEAAFHDDLAEVLKSAFALLIWGGKVIIISTHNGEDNEFNKLVNDIRSGKKKYNLLRCTFDDALKDGLYQRICEKQGIEWTEDKEKLWRQEIIEFYGEDADEELFCIPSKGSGAFLSRTIIENCQKKDIPVLTYAVKSDFAALPSRIREADTLDWLEENIKPLLKERFNPDLTTSFGFDFGRSGDLSVFWPVQENLDQTLSTPFVLELRNVPHEQQKQILFYILDRMPKFNFGALDARGNGSYIAEVVWQRYGSNCVDMVMLTTEWYRANMPIIKSKIEERAISLPLHLNILNDFRMPKVIKGVAVIPDGKVKDTDGEHKRHADSFIACAFAVYASRQEKQVDYDGYMSASELPKEDLEDEKRLFDDGGF